jgi:mannose-6-phosphate isomerase-like protein (cupin superfamily)
MKLPIACALILLGASCLYAAEPEGFAVWKGDAVRNAGKELSGKVDEHKFAFKPLGSYDNHQVGVAYREASGTPELHETQNDILIVESGEALLTVGGTMVDAKTVKPNEVRGTSITGGSDTRVAAGDILHIPAKVPHQLKIAAGSKFSYLVIKVDSK